jgi:hypothetical protein
MAFGYVHNMPILLMIRKKVDDGAWLVVMFVEIAQAFDWTWLWRSGAFDEIAETDRRDQNPCLHLQGDALHLHHGMTQEGNVSPSGS